MPQVHLVLTVRLLDDHKFDLHRQKQLASLISKSARAFAQTIRFLYLLTRFLLLFALDSQEVFIVLRSKIVRSVYFVRSINP